MLHVAVGRGVAVAARFAGGHNRGAGGTVVAAVSRQDLGLAGGKTSHADGVLDGVGATVGEEHVGELVLRLIHDLLSQFTAHIIRERGVLVGDTAGLVLNCLYQLRVRVTQVGAHELAAQIQVAVALVIVNPRAFGIAKRLRVDLFLRRPAVEYVVTVVVAYLLFCGLCFFGADAHTCAVEGSELGDVRGELSHSPRLLLRVVVFRRKVTETEALQPCPVGGGGGAGELQQLIVDATTGRKFRGGADFADMSLV